MTIGKSSKKVKLPRTPSFLDRSGGFYGRLDETEAVGLEGSKAEPTPLPAWEVKEEHGVFDFNQGMMEDDGATLLTRKPSRRSGRWSRRSSKRSTVSQEKEYQSAGRDMETPACLDGSLVPTQSKGVSSAQGPEPTVVHFSITEEADDQVLIRGRKWESVEEKKKRKDGKTGTGEGLEVEKRNTLKNYRKALDRAFRRGWETFITNLYSVTLTPVTSAETSSSAKSRQIHNSALVDYR
ncbi:uncharacterized protein LOC114798459 [Denticeps clupeoides]|uniref:uncharacterized protein LOC114798459 n=1 Tax=Denticeps clupeoides TaxID=299321 RepID=UPI0010A56806|nr:uncharacterized protein LOC114798459 [Denticeps clupeoides]